ncbi:MAG TPA: PfkB family carbohydrate kinase [Bryobacteraceae bacterium]|jgi:fructokinase|nr:PfkB family carbohydrate kinase [Bryobacteraceae bacterium]
MRILSTGEILWDVIGGKEYLGGAPFNFSVHAVRLGHEVKFLSGVGRDTRGDRARREAEASGISADLLIETNMAPTGVSVVSNETGHGRHQLLRPAAFDYSNLSESKMMAIKRWQPDWIYFGTLAQLTPHARALTCSLIEQNPQAQRFYDVNLRPDNYTEEVVRELLGLATIVKLNSEEMPELARMNSMAEGIPFASFARALSERYRLKAVCVTKAEEGCSLFCAEPLTLIQAPGYAIQVADTIGAGDAFAAAFLDGWNAGWPLERVCDFANRVGALMASRPGATPEWTVAEAEAL